MAIEATMNALFPDDSYVNTYFWSIPVVYGESGTQVISLRLERLPNEKWKAYAYEIEAVLSLWLYSVKNVQRLESQKAKSSVDKPNPKDESDWLRAQGPQSNPSLRLLGPRKLEHQEELLQNLQWWMPEGFSGILRVRGIEENSSAYRRGSDTLVIKKCRVVGCGSEGSESSGARGLSKATSSEKSTIWTRFHAGKRKKQKKAVIQVPRSLPQQQQQQQPEPKEVANSVLAIECPDDSLAKLYAKDLLFAFICSAAKKRDGPIKSKARLRPTDKTTSDAWKSFTLWNEEISDLAGKFQAYGFGSLPEIYASIITPLSMEGKLPDPQPVFQLAKDEINKYAGGESWEHSSNVYMWLWEHTKLFRYSHTSTYPRAMAMLIEYLRKIDDEMKLKSIELCELEPLETVRRKMEVVWDSLTQSRETLNDLKRLLKAQGREWKDFSYFQNPPSHAGNSNETTYPKSFGVTAIHLIAMNPEQRFQTTDVQFDMKKRDIYEWTPLHYAAAVGSCKSVTHLLTKQADPNARDVRQWTPLHYASLRKDAQGSSIVNELLDKGASVSAYDSNGASPMHFAAQNGAVDILEALLVEYKFSHLSGHGGGDGHAGARNGFKQLLDYHGRAPIHWAAIAGQIGAMEILLDDSALGTLGHDVKLKDGEGWAPSHLAALYGKHRFLASLLSHYPEVKESKDEGGRTALHLAAKYSRYLAIEVLVGKGAVIDARDVNDWTPLHYAAHNGHRGILEFLLDHNADVNVAADQGMTPLHLLLLSGENIGSEDRLIMTRRLLQAGANPLAENDLGMTPLNSAEKLDNSEDIVHFLEAKVKENVTKGSIDGESNDEEVRDDASKVDEGKGRASGWYGVRFRG